MCKIFLNVKYLEQNVKYDIGESEIEKKLNIILKSIKF